MKNNVYFVSGMDTGIGKSYATGYIAKEWNKQGIKTITQKFIQTGNQSVSEDIELHRRIMQTGFLSEDEERLTMPEVFTYPCSPHLAAEIDKRPIDFAKIAHATDILSERYDAVLLEGAGGLMVPLTRSYLTIDYIAQQQLPLIFVVSGRLGSINHILLSFEAIRNRNIRLHTLAYNLFEDRDGDDLIRLDTKEYIKHHLQVYFPQTEFIEIPIMNL